MSRTDYGTRFRDGKNRISEQMKTWIEETWPDDVALIMAHKDKQSIVREVLSKFRDEVRKRTLLEPDFGSNAVVKSMNELFREVGL
jgi:hypothetical protein